MLGVMKLFWIEPGNAPDQRAPAVRPHIKFERLASDPLTHLPPSLLAASYVTQAPSALPAGCALVAC